jgi:hypothetical protein
MENYPGNSKKQREPVTPEPKKLERIVTGQVVRKKPSIGKRFMETFVGGDAKSAWGFVAYDVLIPAAKDMVAEAFSQGVERILFGESVRGGSRTRGYGGPTRVSYDKIRTSGSRYAPEPPRQLSRRNRSVHNFEEIILETRAEAEGVIDQLFLLCEKYNQATVADLYELVGVTAEYTDRNYGWTDLRGAGATRVRNGYLIDIPRPELLD